MGSLETAEIDFCLCQLIDPNLLPWCHSQLAVRDSAGGGKHGRNHDSCVAREAEAVKHFSKQQRSHGKNLQTE